MRKLSLMAVLTALFCTFSLSSCFNNSDYESYDIYNQFVTIKTDNFMGTPYMVGDLNNTIYTPVSSTVMAALKKDATSYYSRAVVSIKLVDGQTLPKTGGSLQVESISVNGILLTQDMTTDKDSISDKSYSLISIADVDNYGMIWAGNGYINVPFNFNVNNDNLWNFQLYFNGSNQDTLNTVLQKTSETKLNASTSNALISYRIPTDDYETQELIENMADKYDSIVVRVSAMGVDGKTLSKCTKVGAHNLK